MKRILFLFILFSSAVNGQIDTTTVSCRCNDTTYYVRFGYNRSADSTKIINVKKDSVTTKKTIHYLPAYGVAFIYDEQKKRLVKVTGRFRFMVVSDDMDDPETLLYRKKLCNVIIKNKIP